MNIFLSIADSMVSTPLGFIHLLILSDGWKYSRKKTGAIIAVYFGLMVLMDLVVLGAGGTLVEMKRRISILNIISCLIVYFIITYYRDGRMLFSFFSACIFIFIGDTISDIVFYSEAFHLCIKILTFLVIAVLLYRFFRKPFHDVLNTIQNEWWWLALVQLSLCCVFASIIMVPGPLFLNPELQPQAITLCFACVLVYIGFYMMFKSLQKQHEIEENNQLLKLQVNLLEKHTGTLQEMSERIRLYRHDTRHYIRMMSACIENQDWDSASEILKQVDSGLSQSLGSGDIRFRTGEGILDAVLSYYGDWAKREDTEFDVCMAAPPKAKVDITEFSAMLSNALENAMHACEQMEQGTKRLIRVTGRTMQEQYYLEIVNTFEGEIQFDRNQRPLPKAVKHGYGTRSMIDFAERSQGRLEFKAEDGWFFVRIML